MYYRDEDYQSTDSARGKNTKRYDRCDDQGNNDQLKQFVFSVPRNMPSVSPIRLPRGEEKVLATLEICAKHDKHYCRNLHELVWLAATVGWRGNDVNDDLTVEFRIRKNSPEGDIIFATRDGVGVDDGELRGQTTSFNYVDNNRTCKHDVTKYFLTAELIRSEELTDRARVIGPIVFTAAVIS